MQKEGGPLQVNQVRLGAVLSYVSMGLSTLISLIYTPIMLGRLGETEYGVYGAVGPIISYLLLLSMGLGSAYIRYYSQAKVAKDRREMAKLNGMFLVTLSLLGLVLLALGFFLAAHPQMVFGTKWAPEELALGAKLLRIMTLNAALSFPFSVFESHVNIHERYLFLKAVTMAKSVLSPLISIPLLLLGFRSPAIATLSLVLTIVCGLTYMAYCFAVLKMPVSFRTYDLPLMKNMMGFTFYIFLAVVVDQLNYGIGTLMTTWIHGAELSGVYYSANQLNVYYLSFAMAISNVLIPRVHRMVAEGDSNRELTRLMTKAGRLQFIMLMAVFLGFVAVGRPFVILWAGGKEQFAVDYPVALLLFASTIVSAIQFVGLEILRAKNMHRFRAWVYLAAAAVNVGLMIPLCKYGGLVGVAGSILFITVVGNVLPINWYFRRHVGLDVRWFWVRIARLLPSMLVPAIVAVLIAVLAPVSGYLDILIWGCVFVAVYAASLWLFGMNRYERGIVTGVLDKFRRKRRRRAYYRSSSQKGLPSAKCRQQALLIFLRQMDCRAGQGRRYALQLLPDGADGSLFQAAHLGLGYADLRRNLHLGLSLVEAHHQNAALPGRQAADGVLQGNALDPALVGAAAVADLVHDAYRVAALRVYGLVQGHRVHDGVHGQHHLLPGDGQLLGQLLHSRLPLTLAQQTLPGLEDLIRRVPQASGHPDGAVVPEIPPDLPHDHGNAVGRKAHRLVDIEVVNGLDEADTAHLEQVVHVLTPAGKSLEHRQHQPQVAPDELLPGGHVSLLGPP